MQRMTWWLLCWLLLSLSHANMSCDKDNSSHGQSSSSGGQDSCMKKCKHGNKGCGSCCLTYVDDILKNGTHDEIIDTIESLEVGLEEEDTDGTSQSNNVIAYIHKPNGTFKGLNIYASDQKASDSPLPTSTVRVQLPGELEAGPNNTIVFCMLKWPETNLSILGASYDVNDRRLVGLSVQGRNISGLQQRVNITMSLTKEINETQQPSCQFFNFSTKSFSQDGCITQWTRGQDNVICSCNHLTYFAVLMLSVSPGSLSATDQKILTYISLIGCSLSLFALIITALLFITNRKLREDVSMKVHMNLVIALILLNLHFLPSQTAAAGSSTGLCLYVALVLHFSLLATFSWMALEGFHLYLLLVKVFNVYINRYLLKLSVVGWGVPTVIVSVVVIIDKNFYGRAPLDKSNSNDTAICYITNDSVKMGTTLGLFSLMFLFNIIMFGVTVRRIWILRSSSEFGQSNRDRAKKDMCTLLGVVTLLGITWGLIFFSFGYLTTPGIYLFCILNSLQGFFILIWFVMSLRKAKTSATMTSTETRSTSS